MLWNKKKSFLAASGLAATLALGCAMFCGSKLNSLSFSASGGEPYQIRMDSTNNRFHAPSGNTPYDGDAVVKTNLGNDVAFSYYQIKGTATTWHVLGAGGYFYNTDPIRGLSSISLTFKTNGADYSILYSSDMSFDHSVSKQSSSEGETFDFGGFLPNYFKIVNESGTNFNISSVTLSFSCANQYPYLSLTNEQPEMGTITGGGNKTYGESVTIRATPNSGYRFVGWYDGEDLVSSSADYTFSMASEDLFYTARFGLESYNLVVSSESVEKGSVDEASGSYLYGSDVEVGATPNEGYSFNGWYSGSSLVSMDNPYRFTMPYQNLNYVARFSANQYAISLSSDAPELGEVSGAGTFAYRSSVTITANAHTGVSFLGWYDGEELISSQKSYTFSMPHESLSYVAKFAWTPYAVSIAVNDETMGSVAGDGSYTYGQTVTLVATPNAHHSFFGWYLGDELVSAEASYSFFMPDASVTYAAKFVPNHAIELYSDDDSILTVTGPTEWGEGMGVTVSATATDGYALDYWYDDDLNAVSFEKDYTFVMPDHDLTLYAAFADGYVLFVSSSDESKGSVSGSGHYKAGREVTVAMEQFSGIFKGWYSGDELVSGENPYTFSMPASDYSLVATFMTQEEERIAALGGRPVVSSDGTTVTYGAYPQVAVSDASIISSLDALSGPDETGYYPLGGIYYHKEAAKPYDGSCKFDDGTTIVSGTSYWFKVEPIQWKVLSETEGTYFLTSSVLLDAHRYNEYYTGTKGGCYANNYANSEIRSWLNSDFLSSAFPLGYGAVQTTQVNNSVASTGYSSNDYACGNTDDKIFLLSAEELETSVEAMKCRTTDYARARGAGYSPSYSSIYNGFYWTRSPYSGYSGGVRYVASGGSLDYDAVVTTNLSVRPSLNIKVS